MKSALLIQRWYRRYQSRIEVKKKTAWNIYQSIEYSGEQDQLKLCNFFLTLIKNSALLDSMNPSTGSKLKNDLSSIAADTTNQSTLNQEKNTKLIQKVFRGSIEETELRKQKNINELFLNHNAFFELTTKQTCPYLSIILLA